MCEGERSPPLCPADVALDPGMSHTASTRWHDDSRLEFLLRCRDRYAAESEWDRTAVNWRTFLTFIVFFSCNSFTYKKQNEQ
eukprot:206714-Amphidinium_carterae.1